LVQDNTIHSKFIYEDNIVHPDICDESKCVVKIDIENSAEFPVYLASENLFNLHNKKIENVSSCKFTRVYIDMSPNSKRKIDDICSGNSCDLEIRELHDDKWETVHSFRVYLDSDGVVKKSSDWVISKPGEIHFEFEILCDNEN